MAINFRIPNILKAVTQGVTGTGLRYVIWSQGTNYSKDADKLKMVLSNPAALFLITLLCDLCALGEFKLYRRQQGGERTEVDSHPVLDLLRDPNWMQTEEQFKWDYMFWRLLGTANMLSDSKVLKSGAANQLYWLSPDCIDWPKWFEDNKHTLFFSKQKVNELQEKTLSYKTRSQKYTFRYKEMKQFFDLSNGVGGWFKGPSRLDALYKIVANSDNILDSKNVASRLAAKFLVAGKGDIENISSLPMGQKEKEDIERKVLSKQAVHAVKNMVDIKRFLEDLGGLEKLDKAFMNDAFLIGKMYNIPKDVIESFEQGSTYENQEKARAAIIYYCVSGAANDLCRGILEFFEVADHELELDYSHLPFVQTFEKDKAETLQKKALAFKTMVSAGVRPEDAAELCGFELTEFNEPVNLGNDGAGADGNKKLKAV